MLQNHILSEVLTRLAAACVSQRTLDRVLTGVGIDKNEAERASTTAVETAQHDGSASFYTGFFEFDVTVEVFGQLSQHRCRARFEQTVDDDIDEASGNTVRLPIQKRWEYEVLDWEAYEPTEEALGVSGRRSAPQWQPPTLFNLMPPAAERELIEKIEDHVIDYDAKHRNVTGT